MILSSQTSVRIRGFDNAPHSLHVPSDVAPRFVCQFAAMDLIFASNRSISRQLVESPDRMSQYLLPDASGWGAFTR